MLDDAVRNGEPPADATLERTLKQVNPERYAPQPPRMTAHHDPVQAGAANAASGAGDGQHRAH